MLLMNNECFRFKGNPFTAQLYANENQVYCPVRENYFSLVNKPEELVRQSILNFLTQHCAEYYSEYSIKIEVEHESMDIAIYLKIDDEVFNPEIVPLLIIETKRDDIVLDTDQNECQISRYMELKKCHSGILFNGDSAFLYERQQKKQLSDFLEILEIIRKNTENQKKIFDVHRQFFKKAEDGDFENFIELIKIYGSTSKTKFLYRKNKQLIQSIGINFFLKDNQILFRNQGFYTKNRSSITKDEFDRLVSIRKIS